MDSRVPCSLTDNQTMDANIVWQWRIMHVKKYSLHPEPFHYSNKIGLDFNVASTSQKKMDLKLLTNGILLEVCDFAKTLNKSKRHFITNILEKNFDLGLETEQQRIDFTAQTLHKVRELIRNPSSGQHEVFALFDTSSKPECTSNGNSGLKIASTDCKMENFLFEMDDTVDGDEDKFNCCQTREQTESHSHETDGVHTDDCEHEHESECSGAQLTEDMEDHLPSLFPYSEELGLNFDIGSKQSLDPGLLTKGVMLELVHFTRLLTSSYSRIILDVLEHNWDLDLKNNQVKNQVWFQISRLLKRRRQLTSSASNLMLKFEDEPFTLQTNPLKRPRVSTQCNMGLKRLITGPSYLDTNIISQNTNICCSGKAEDDSHCSRPSVESDVRSDKITGPGNAGCEDQSQNLKGCSFSYDILKESEPSSVDVSAPSLASTDMSSSQLILNSNMDQLFESQPDPKGLLGVEDQTHPPENVLNECDLEREDMETWKNMWKLRSNCVEKILSLVNKEFVRFKWFRVFTLEFNVGFCPKQNISVDSLANCVLLKIAKFALAMNSSRQDFIMEILEYNFNFGLQTQQQRNIFTCEIMDRVRRLKRCEDTVKFSNKVFELPCVDSAIPDVSSILRMEKSDVTPVCPPDSHIETKESTSCKAVDLYPWCKEIGLKLHVNNSEPTKKLEISKLTKGAMTEVINFAEKLCGTYEEICLDVLRHNFDLDFQSGDSDVARTVLAKIPAAMEQKNLSLCVKSYNKIRRTRKNIAIKKTDYQNNSNLDACSAGSSQAAVIDQNELNLQLWKLRANVVQRILAVPHEEHCPLYFYSRCKKVGIDFNVGSGVKQNLDPKLLTNGIMVEFNTFATTLVSATEYFVTEILEYNFNLNLKNELYRSIFAQQTQDKIGMMNKNKRLMLRNKMLFELPDVNCIQDSIHETTTFCPKCYQDRNDNLNQFEYDANHVKHPYPNIMTDTITADVNRTTQKPATHPSLTLSSIEEDIMDNYPCCKRIGLNLCVNKVQPKDQLDMHLLTYEIMNEVVAFAKTLSGTKSNIIHTLLEHNFKTGKQNQELDLVQMFRAATGPTAGEDDWFNEVFVIRAVSHRQPGHVSKVKWQSALRRSEIKDTIQKRKLALQKMEERATLQVDKNCYPICTEIGLDLDVTSKSEKKDKLELTLLTNAVVLEIHIFATQKIGHYYPRTMFDILDYNFDLSSQYYRRWEFSIATASKVQAMVKHHKKLHKTYEIFKLPFVFDPKGSKRFEETKQNNKNANFTLNIASESESNLLDVGAPFLMSAEVSSSLQTVNTNVSPTRNILNEYDMEQEEFETENSYTCPLGESDLDSDVTDSNSAGDEDHQNAESCFLNSDLPREAESSCLGIPEFVHTSNNSTSSSSSSKSFMYPVNQLDEKELSENEEQIQTPRNSPSKCEMGPEQMETESNMWKLRSNRVEQILSALNKEFGPFNRSKKVGFEFNVGYGPMQNISVNSLTNSVLLEIAKFALAINSSQKEFVMEILEYNFDLGLQSQLHRNIFACEIMEKVRRLKSCEDVVNISDNFELFAPMMSKNLVNESVGSVTPALNTISSGKVEKGDFSTMCRSVDPYPRCKEIGLKLQVNNNQPTKKLEINKLTIGAMLEVTTFAERLCGTFEQICLDILRHNLNSGLQCGDADVARNILEQIPAAMEQRNLSTCVKSCKKIKGTRKNTATMEQPDHQNNPNLDACSVSSSQAASMDQTAGSSSDLERKKELNLQLWKLRTNQIHQILSVPHEEHCPLYFYSRCKKLGIDFNVGLGVKQNLDLKLLTNGIMVEFNTFATALGNATKHFITEILEYNFNLNLKNELCRTAFGHQTFEKIKSLKSSSVLLKNKHFQLPDTMSIQKPTYDKTTYCPTCYQKRNHKHLQDENDFGLSHTTDDTFAADANCTSQNLPKNPSPTFSTIEAEIMDSYPFCKKIGLNLCVSTHRPKGKLDMQLFTRGMMSEVLSFAKRLCGTKSKIICALLEHNFDIGKHIQEIDFVQMFRRATARKEGGLSWFNEVFEIRPVCHRQPGHVGKVKEASVMHRSEWKETIKKRKLALQMKEKKATLPSQYLSVAKSENRKRRSTGNCYPICTKIGLDLDVKSKSGGKDKLDMKLLTTAVVVEIHNFAQRAGRYTTTVFDILDYNFDLSSQHYRCQEFSVNTASKIQAMVKQYRKNKRPDKVFKLPFVLPAKKQKKCKMNSQEEPIPNTNRASCVSQVRYHSYARPIDFLGDKTIDYHWSNENKMSPAHLCMINMPTNSEGCDRPLYGNIQATDPYYGSMKLEPDTEENYGPHNDDAETDEYTLTTNVENSITKDSENKGVKYYILAEPRGSEGQTWKDMLSVYPKTDSSIETDSSLACVQYLVPVDAASFRRHSMITTGQVKEDALIKEEQDLVPVDSYHYGIESCSESEMDVKME